MGAKLSVHARRVSDAQVLQAVTASMSNSPGAGEERKQRTEL